MPRKTEIDGSANATEKRASFEERAVSVKDRPIERLEEDQAFVPVIVKRTDEARRHPDDVLVTAIAEGLEQLCRPALSLGLSSIAAGLILGFTAMAVAVATVAAEPLGDWPMLSAVRCPRLSAGLCHLPDQRR